MACSQDSLADRSDATLVVLKEKHPLLILTPLSLPPAPDVSMPGLSVSTDDGAHAIGSFPNGSAGGPVGLRPQHFKDTTTAYSRGPLSPHGIGRFF